MIFLQIRAWVLVLVLHRKQLRSLLLLEALTNLLILLCLVEIGKEHVETFFGVLLRGGDFIHVRMQIGVDLIRNLLRLLHLIIQLTLTVVDETMGWNTVLVNTRRHVLLAHFLAVNVLFLRHDTQLVVKRLPRIIVLKIKARTGTVIEWRRFCGILVVVVARWLGVIELVIYGQRLRFRIRLR